MVARNSSYRILILEDVESDAQLIEAELRRSEIAFESRRVWTVDAFLESLADSIPDVILADFRLPEFTAIEALHLLRERQLKIPFVLVTGVPVEQIAVDCMHEGADDYILKASLRRLPAAIQNAVAKRQAETEREAVEQALRRSEELYRLITENTRDLVVLLNAAGEVLYVSPSSSELLGFSREEILVGAVECIIPPDDRLPAIDAFRKMMLDPALTTEEVRCRHRNGKWRTFESRGSWIRADREGARRAVLVLRDISKRKEAAERALAANAALQVREIDLLRALAALQESHENLQSTQLALIEAEKMESVGRLAAGVAHEVKNPLTAIVMGIEYLRNHLPESPSDLHGVLQDMDEAIKRANRVVRGMLDFSAPSTLERQRVQLNDIIEKALVMVKHQLSQRQIDVTRVLAADLPELSLDGNKIEQVFVNIFLNAIEAMQETGTLGVTTAVRKLAHVAGRPGEVRGLDGDAVVVAEVEDTGSGIPEEHLARVFDPFFTTKPTGQGTGLGMTVIKKILEMHGGAVRIQNRPQGGAKVTLFFPMCNAD